MDTVQERKMHNNDDILCYCRPKLKKLQSVLYQKLRTLFDTIRDHRDIKSRQLSVIFNKLPSKTVSN